MIFIIIAYPDFKKANLKSSPMETKIAMLGLLLLPIILGLFGLVSNRFQNSVIKARKKMYKEKGFSDKEALEQSLADTRSTESRGGDTYVVPYRSNRR